MLAIRPHNWSKFQHYKLRRPPWIKLHRELLDDFHFHALPIASKALAPMLWLLASEDEQGIIMGDETTISFRLRISPEELRIALKPLMDQGLFEDASIVLAGRLQLATSESETEAERESEGDASAALAPSRARGVAREAQTLKPRATREEWATRLESHRPDIGKRNWKPFWGPPPDQLGSGHFMPEDMLEDWRSKHAIVKSA